MPMWETDTGSIPGLGRSPGGGHANPVQYSWLENPLGQRNLVGCSPYNFKEWASLLAQLVKNLPAMQETPVQFVGQEYPLEKGKATHSSILAWRIPIDRGAWQAPVHGGTKTRLSN